MNRNQDFPRMVFIQSFDDIRPSFLAAIDQIVSEMRPKVVGIPGFYSQSVLACAHAFADFPLIRTQLAEIAPEILPDISDKELFDAHLSLLAYLFSLSLHELIRNQKEIPGRE